MIGNFTENKGKTKEAFGPGDHLASHGTVVKNPLENAADTRPTGIYMLMKFRFCRRMEEETINKIHK